MILDRSCGVLLHPTSLPGPYGIGDLGPESVAFLEFLSDARQGWWQMLPLGPVGAGFSPYQSSSSFAGNPLLISPDRLITQGLLEARDLQRLPKSKASRVDPGSVLEFKTALLEKAYRNFGKSGRNSKSFQDYVQQESAWLEDFALFEAIREQHAGNPWSRWPSGLAQRTAESLVSAQEQLDDRIGYHLFVQFVFHAQWEQLRHESRSRGIRLIGDIPIFVSLDSADVWSNPTLFQLNEQNQPRAVAGVPPDYFNSDGQLWGNPVYDWEAHEKQSFRWWISRIRSELRRVDLIRLDHFRGFESYWEIPANAKTARNGKWVPSPGIAFFKSLRENLGELPFIAEDLGEITPPVHELRQSFDLPGMKVLQFAFGARSGDHPYLPHNYPRNCVVYTGTHDNDTSKGWFKGISRTESRTPANSPSEAEFALNYLGCKRKDVVKALIRSAYASVADLAIIPMQDIAELGSSARMNIPGQATGNWVWRLADFQLSNENSKHLAELANTFGRIPVQHTGNPPK